MVARLDLLLLFLVLARMLLGVAHHSVDLGVRKPARGLDADLLLLAGGAVLGRHVQDAVGVDVEGHLDLRHAARRRGNPGELELADGLVVERHLALALEHVDLHRGLVVLRGREHLRLARRDGGVALDQRRHDPAQSLDAERQRNDVQQEHVLDLAGQHAALDGRADADHLVRIDAPVRLLAEELAHDLLDLGDARRTADQDDLVDVVLREPGVLERRLHRRDGPLQQAVGQLLEARARQRIVEVLGAFPGRRDEGQVDVGLHRRRELHLGLLRGFLQPLQRHRVLRQVDALLLLELRHQPVDDHLVDVVSAEVGVAVGGLHLEDAIAQLEDGDVVGSATQVEDRDLLVLLLVQPVGERRRRGLVDDAPHFEARDLAGVLGRLALRVVEVRGHRDDGLGHLLAEIVLRGLLHLLQDERGDLRRVEGLVGVGDPDLDPPARVAGDLVGDQLALLADLGGLAAHEALDGEDGVVRVGDGLPAGHLADQTLAVLGERHHRGRCAPALRAGDDDRLAAFHDRDHRVGRPQIDTDDLAHLCSLAGLQLPPGGLSASQLPVGAPLAACRWFPGFSGG